MFESEQHAISILKRDHQKVKDLFDEFEDTDRRQQKMKIAETVIKELKAHSFIEEEIFYPAVRKAVGEKVMSEADEEHHVAKVLIAELEGMSGSESNFDAKFTVLAENIRHHIKEEESMMLPKAKSADLDFEALGDKLLSRKEELLDQGFPAVPEEEMVRSVKAKGRSKSVGKSRKAAATRHKKKAAAHHGPLKNGHAHPERSRV